MKQLLLLIICCSLGYICKAQTQEFEPNFLAGDFLLYKGVLLKLKDDDSSRIGYIFYKDLEICQTLFRDKMIYQDSNSFLNKIFRVEDIVNKKGVSIKENYYLERYSYFILEDVNSKEKFYYQYDSQIENSFSFKTSRIPLDDNSVCSEIGRQSDDFTGDINFNTPFPDRINQALIVLFKSIKKTKTLYYLSLQTYSSTVVVDGSIVMVLFTDGTKWSKSVKIKVEAKSDGYKYNAFVPLTHSDSRY